LFSQLCFNANPQFDAIVTDPPYSRREKAHGFSVSADAPMGDPHSTYTTLFRLAARRLKPGGRLVFWLPTDAFLSDVEVKGMLDGMVRVAADSYTNSDSYQGNEHRNRDDGQQNRVGNRELSEGGGDGAISGLKFERMTKEELHNSLWRWMCVYTKT
jgi:tRNA G10  N-methylase Trm11